MFHKAETERGRGGVVQTCHVLSPGWMALEPLHSGRPRCSSPHCLHRQGCEMCFGGGGLPTRLGARTSAQRVAAGPTLGFPMPQGLLLCCLPHCSQQDKRALSPGNSWLSYFSFRPHLLVGAVVTSQAGHDIQDAFFRSPRAKPNLPLQLCREKCRGGIRKAGQLLERNWGLFGQSPPLPKGSAAHPKTGQSFPGSQTSWTGVFGTL